MGNLPRIALGTVQPLADSQAVAWALMEALSRQGQRVQHFLSRACFLPVDGATAITGLGSRHLDSWLMSPDVCRELLVRSAANSDLALVQGGYDCAGGQFKQSGDASEMGGRLDLLCDWLTLPRVAVIDVSQLSDCHLPARPAGIEGLLLDGFTDDHDLCRLQTLFETLWGVPVFGGLCCLPQARSVIDELPTGSLPPAELLKFLGDHFERHTRTDRIRALASRRDWSDLPELLFRPGAGVAQVRVAVAYDAAFHCYFPDTLDLLEMRGATVVDFSPLKDEALPLETDIVYLGCGHPERFARELAGNHCMTMALRNHVCEGRRVYAEGGGLAYLCRQIALSDGTQLPMTGVLPAIARANDQPWKPQPVEATVVGDNWLAGSGTRLRGYLNQNWILEPAGDLAAFFAERGQELDLAGRHHAVGSRVHLNFAALPEAFRSFLKPHAASLDLASSRCSQR